MFSTEAKRTILGKAITLGLRIREAARGLDFGEELRIVPPLKVDEHRRPLFLCRRGFGEKVAVCTAEVFAAINCDDDVSVFLALRFFPVDRQQFLSYVIPNSDNTQAAFESFVNFSDATTIRVQLVELGTMFDKAAADRIVQVMRVGFDQTIFDVDNTTLSLQHMIVSQLSQHVLLGKQFEKNIERLRMFVSDVAYDGMLNNAFNGLREILCKPPMSDHSNTAKFNKRKR
jgi:hypothetical protein